MLSGEWRGNMGENGRIVVVPMAGLEIRTMGWYTVAARYSEVGVGGDREVKDDSKVSGFIV